MVREELLGLFTHSESRLTPETQPAGQGLTPPSRSLGTFFRVCLVATPGIMAKFALNQNLPGECAKWDARGCKDPDLLMVCGHSLAVPSWIVARGPFLNVYRVSWHCLKL